MCQQTQAANSKHLRTTAALIRALTIDDVYAPTDSCLLVVLDLAATNEPVAAFLHVVTNHPAAAMVANFDPPADLVRALGSVGVDWSKFYFLLPRIIAANQVLAELYPR